MVDGSKEPALTSSELKAVRELLKSEERVKWFWGTMKTWAIWTCAVAAGFFTGIEVLGKLVKFVVK